MINDYWLDDIEGLINYFWDRGRYLGIKFDDLGLDIIIYASRNSL